MVQCRVLAASPDHLRSGTSTQGGRPDQCRALPITADGAGMKAEHSHSKKPVAICNRILTRALKKRVDL